jgi:hypothetical protein
MEAFEYTKRDIAAKVAAASKVWASELHKYADELKKLAYKRRRNLTTAQEDVTERKITLEKRKKRAEEMDAVAIELGAGVRLQQEEEDLRSTEAAVASMSEGLANLEARFAAVPSLAWPVLEQLRITDTMHENSADELDLPTLLRILEDLQGLGDEDDE